MRKVQGCNYYFDFSDDLSLGISELLYKLTIIALQQLLGGIVHKPGIYCAQGRTCTNKNCIVRV